MTESLLVKSHVASAGLTKFLLMKIQEEITIRNIRPEDNPHLANIVRTTLAEFGANKPGTVYFDPTTDALYDFLGRAVVGLPLFDG